MTSKIPEFFMNVYEIIGYTGSFLIALSLTMKNIWWLRRINLLGASSFALYGFLIKAYPVLILNSYIALIDIFYLIQMYKKDEYFSLVLLEPHKCNMLKKFYDLYFEDIKHFFPGITKEKISNGKLYFILRNIFPVGLISYKLISPGEAEIILDYAIPDYRDLKNARFVYFAEDGLFKKEGIKKLIARSDVEAHQKYLIKLGFARDKADPAVFYKML